MTIDVATGIVRILKQEGVGWVSTFPVCRVNNALGREGVPMLMMRDDRYAVAVADAFSRITAGSRIGVCTFQGGVNAAGMQYAYAGMAQAYEDGSPVLCITDGVPAGSSGNSQYDVASAMKTVSKWFGYLDKPERTPEFMRRAFTMLRSGRPGPVILAIPNATATYDETADPYRPVKGWKSAPDPADVRAAVDHLLAARNPLIYAGEGVIYAGASEELKALAEILNVPVITTLKAKGAFPENHPLFVGVRGDQVAHYLNKSDVILAVGSSLSPGQFSHGIPDAAKKTIILCNVDELHINKMIPTAHAVIGDARFTLQALRQEVSGRTSGAGRAAGDVAAEVRAARDEALARYRQVMNSDETPINPYRVYGDLMQVLDLRNSFVTHQVRQHARPVEHRVRHAHPAGLSGLGQCLHSWLQPGCGDCRQEGVSGAGIRGGDRRGGPWLHARQPRGSVARETRGHGRAHQQWRLCRLWTRLLGARTRSLHTPGAGARRGGYVEGDRSLGLPHRAGERAGRGNPGPAAGARRQYVGSPGLYRVHLFPVPGLWPVGWTGGGVTWRPSSWSAEASHPRLSLPVSTKTWMVGQAPP